MKNNGNSNGSGSGTARKPTAEEYIVYHLHKHGRSTIHEIRVGIGYSHSHVWDVATDLEEANVIAGEQTDRIVGAIINDVMIPLTGNRKGMIRKLMKADQSLANRVKSQNLPVEDIHRLLKKHAQAIVQLGRKWEFWLPAPPSPSGSSGSAEAQADD